MSVKILVVEDDVVDQMAFKRAVQKEQIDYDFRIVDSVSDAKAILNSEQFDILLLDFNLGDGTAADIFPSIKDTPFIVATGSGDEAKAVIAMKAGAYDYLVKDPERNYLKTLPYLVENAIKRKQTEKSLHEKEVYLQTVYDKIYEGIVTVTPSGIFESINLSAEAMFGYSQAELIGKNTDILLPEAFFQSDDALYNHLKTGKIRIINSGFETDVKRKNSSIFTMEFTVSEIYPGGRWLYILACRDVMEQRRYERLLYEQTLRDGLTGLYNKKALSNILIDELERTIRYNRPMTVVMLDIDYFKKLNDTYGHLAGDEVLIGVSKIILDIFINRTVICRLKKLSDITTRFGTGELSVRSFISGRDEIGTLTMKFNIMADFIEAAYKKQEEEIRERKQIQERQTQLINKIEEVNKVLDQKNIELGEVNKELNDFAYVVSHDIKAPLRAITSLSEWLVTDYSDKLNDEGRKSLNMIKERAIRLIKMIEGILLYSRAGSSKEEKEDVNLNELIRSIIDLISQQSNITINIKENLPFVHFERTKIQQVFQNLITNAVKFMDKPEGIITISCVTDDYCHRFSVSDNGPGIEEKDFNRIFTIFQTAHHKDMPDSTGVGLSIEKKIIEKSGGRIWLESKIGEGTTFYFTIPV